MYFFQEEKEATKYSSKNACFRRERFVGNLIYPSLIPRIYLSVYHFSTIWSITFLTSDQEKPLAARNAVSFFRCSSTGKWASLLCLFVAKDKAILSSFSEPHSESNS